MRFSTYLYSGLIGGMLMALSAPASLAEPMVSTLTLDVLSYVSFEDEKIIPLPAGATITFSFGESNEDGTVPFVIEPSGVMISPVSSSDLGATLQYALASSAPGLLTPMASERKIEFSGVVSARDLAYPDTPGREYKLAFTTEHAEETSLDGAAYVSVNGYRPPEGADYVQLVGATVNRSENEHGAAVYMVLSGVFDQLP